MSTKILGNNNYSNYTGSNKSTNTSWPLIFKDGIPNVLVKSPKQGEAGMRFRILPSYDLSQLSTEAFPTTELPFKNPDGSLTNWVVCVKAWLFFGNLYNHILSPATYNMKAPYPPRGCDPLADLAYFISSNLKKGTTYQGTNTPLITEEEDILINGIKGDQRTAKFGRRPKVYALMNALVENSETKQWEPKIVVCPEYLFQDFAEDLNTKPGRNDPVIDPNFEDYLFGDITSMDHGCIVEVRYNPKATFGTAKFHVSIDNDTLTGYQKMPLDRSYLTTRKCMHDAENVLDIKSSQDILDIMCKDPIIPVETLRKAYEYGVFDSTLTLNLDLREKGLEQIRKREEKRNNKGFSGVTSSAPTKVASDTQSSIPFASKIANDQSYASQYMVASIPTPVKQPSVSQGIGVNTSIPQMGVIGSSNMLNAGVNASNYLQPSTPPSFDTQDDYGDEIPMGDVSTSSQTMSEDERLFAELQTKLSSATSLSAEEVNKFMMLKNKLGK